MKKLRCLVVLVAALSTYGCGSQGDPGVPGEAGADAATALISTSAEAEGDNCASGGVRVDSGVDDDGDGALSDAEIDSTSFVCNGPAATPGNPGSDGADGMDGNPGVDGLTSLIATSDEPAGANCEFGGSKIESGVDDDGNGTLEATEVDQTEYICNGADGISTLSRTTAEPAGPNCANGGILFEVGLDADRSGALDDPEVNASQYVCNGEDGAPGVDGTDGIDGTNGTNGTDGTNGIDGTNGTDGLQSLIVATDEPAGMNCESSGVRVDWGLDINGNDILDMGEVDGTEYVCVQTISETRWGTSTELAGTTPISQGFLLGQKVTVTETTTLTHIGFWGRATANHKTGVYTDLGGDPDQLVAQVGPRGMTVGSQEVPTTPANLSPGDYWIMTVYETVGQIASATSGTVAFTFVGLPYASALPTTFPANPPQSSTPEFNQWLVTSP